MIMLGPRGASDPTEAAFACPYCSVVLEEAPRSRERCPACGRSVWIGAGPDGRQYLLRDDELASHAARWREHHTRAEWIRAAEPFIDAAGFATLEAELLAAGKAAHPRAVYWVAAERALGSIVRSGRWDVIRDAYGAMARVAYEEGDGSMSDHALALAREAMKAQLRLLGETRITILSCGCDRCSGLAGPVSAAEELAAPRLPHPDCREGWCVCEYRPVVGVFSRLGLARH
jgi:hypothetical protein